ncbi:MAG: heavy metal-associated domain-containing protein [Burkholderiaceae bacterium]
MQTIELDVQGMTCGGCVASVQRLLKGVAGVDKAEVDLAQHHAVVTFDERSTGPQALIAAIEDGGFEATIR